MSDRGHDGLEMAEKPQRIELASEGPCQKCGYPTPSWRSMSAGGDASCESCNPQGFIESQEMAARRRAKEIAFNASPAERSRQAACEQLADLFCKAHGVEMPPVEGLRRTLVSGDWMMEGEHDHPLGFPAYVPQHRWNGWACPLVSLDVLERFVIPEQEKLRSVDGGWECSPKLEIAENEAVAPGKLLCYEEAACQLAEDEEAEPFWIEPGKDGLFDISFGWTWQESF